MPHMLKQTMVFITILSPPQILSLRDINDMSLIIQSVMKS